MNPQVHTNFVTGMIPGMSRSFPPRTPRAFPAAAVWVLLLALGFVLLPVSAWGQALSDAALAKVDFVPKPGAQLSLDLPFKDETGRSVRLQEEFHHRPVLLVLGYYRCPMLCTFVLDGLAQALNEVPGVCGQDYDIVAVSIDPRETPVLAGQRRHTFLTRYGRRAVANGCHFLVGNEAAIERLTQEAGFHYAYDKALNQYAHASGVLVVTGQGKIAQCLFGVSYPPVELGNALEAASQERVLAGIRPLLLLCFHYNPLTGKYSLAIVKVLRLASALTVLGLAAMMFWARTRRPPGTPSESPTKPHQTLLEPK